MTPPLARAAGIGLGCILAGAFGAQAAAAVSDHSGDALLPTIDVRTEQKVPQVAPRAAARLEARLGTEGFAETDQRTGALSFVGRTDGFLTVKSSDDPADIVLTYVQGNRAAFGLDRQDLSALTLTESYTSTDGVTHVTFAQTAKGLESFDTYLRGNVAKDGRLINISGAPVPDLSVSTATPALNADQALLAARSNVGGDDTVPSVDQRSDAPDQHTDYETYAESARLTIFAAASGDRLAWDVHVLDADSILYRVVVDALTGDILSRYSLTAHAVDDATVWNDHPSKLQPPLTVNFATDPNWLSRSEANGSQLIGNNTHTYVDNNGINGYQSVEKVVRNPGTGNWSYPMTWYNQAGCPVFGCTWSSATPATKTVNRNAGAVSLFYLTNRFHDHLLAAPIGFDEASRNFEHVNASGQGIGNDAVLAEAQDSSGTNNANFSTPADGSAPRMQMYLWDGDPGAAGPTYDVDGSAAADVVYHEYTHGLSNRLVGNGGGLSQLQSGAMGEGWSDFYSLDFLVASGSRADAAGVPDVWIGDYAPGVPGFFGGVSRVRHQAIDCPVGSASANCPASGTAGAGGYTYGDLGKVGVVNGVHDGGEIWSQTMWDLRETLGRTNALKIITGGMRLSPNNPSMLDMRNSILQSATVNGIDTSAVWSVFAARGMGYRASTANANANSATEDFTVPPALEATTVTVDDNSPRGDGDGVAEPGETLAMKVTLKNNLSGPSTPLTAALTVSDGLVTQGSSKWPALTAGASAMGTPAMALTLPETIQCGTGITLSVTANSPDGTVDIPNRQIVLGKPSFANSADIPKVIPDGNVGGVNSTFTLPGSGTIQNLSVRLGQINHTWVGDLKITLSHAGTTVTLVNRIGEGGSGSSSDNIVNMILDDGAAGPVDRAPYTAGGFTGSFRPEEPLSAFNGHSFSGVWTLNVADLNPSDTGTLQQWGLGPRVCDTFGLPTSVTNAASAVGVNAATLNGAHNSGGNATDYRFEWGTSTGYGQTTALTAGGSSASAVPVSAALTGLAPSTTYHYRLVALRDGFVLSRGADQVFTTAAPPPVVVPDTTAPVVKVTKAPKKKMKTKRAKVRVAVRFSSEPGAAFTCKLNKAAAKACTSPFKAKVAAKPGKGKKHAIVIVARDAAGNTSTPAAVRFTVVRRR